MKWIQLVWLPVFSGLLMLNGCRGNRPGPPEEAIAALNLKTGPITVCGSSGSEFGTVDFKITGSDTVQYDFNTALELLHSFEYDEAEKVFAKVIGEAPDCAMAYWGVAMCNFHPLWESPAADELAKGAKAIEIAKSISRKTELEAGFITAVDAYYENTDKAGSVSRNVRFEKAMERLHTAYPGDREAAIFYALALDAAAKPGDKNYSNQLKAGDILNALYKEEPNHPGIIHYIIHTYDYPGIAKLGLQAAKRYADVAPASAHALHMPSHIFTRLGLWDDCIHSNLRSISAARCYAQSNGIKGHWDEELHGLDYLIYAYLQKGNNRAAYEKLQYLSTINDVYPANFKCAYTFAAAPSRMALENKNWKAAADLTFHPINFSWKNYPWQAAILHFARLLGMAHTDRLELAELELDTLNVLFDTLQNRKDPYKSKEVAIQIKSGEAWINFMKDRKTEAIKIMELAADMEDSTSKHPVTPGEVLPARELYGDMLFQLGHYANALKAYESVLQKSPNRFNSLYGAGLAAERSGSMNKTIYYYRQLTSMADPESGRTELAKAISFLKKHGSASESSKTSGL